MNKPLKAPRQKAAKYLSNKELLAEIARCKKTFCSFISPEYAEYDAIVSSIDSVTPVYVEELLEKLNSKLLEGQSPKSEDGLVFRVMTYDHIPLDPDRKRKSRATNQSHARTNFPPFKHYLLNIVDDNKVWSEVGRSHWDGDFETGTFTVDKGKMSNRLGLMFMLLVEKYSVKSNFRGYCVDEKTEALTQRGWLSYSEIKDSDKVLSYSDGVMVWSDIKSIYIDKKYNGDMYKLSGLGLDALVTPNHKFVTPSGIKPIEMITTKDHLVLMGSEMVNSENNKILFDMMMGDSFVYTGDEIDKFMALSAKMGLRTIVNDDGSVSPISQSYNRDQADNIETVYYTGVVWCVETMYGSFVVRRNGTVHLTGNSYREDMKGLALMHLAQVGLQFDESKSNNPFAFFTTTLTHCFVRVINIEKKNQTIRDDLLVHMGMAPSYTRQIENEMAQSGITEPKKIPPKRGRKPAAQVAAEKNNEAPDE